jgi:hypothetical protein
VSIDFRVRAVQTVCIKSWTAVDFIGWVSGRNPDLKTIFASFDELGDLQRIFDDDRFKMLFPNEVDTHLIDSTHLLNDTHKDYSSHARCGTLCEMQLTLTPTVLTSISVRTFVSALIQ